MATTIIVILLISLSAICSGLNIALISLDPDSLKRKAKLGDKRAKRVLPLRTNPHLSLASILLTNVAVISATSLVLNEQFSGLIAGIISTLLIVIFGELAPQALFTKHALAVCSYLSPLLKLMILVTYPVSKPLQIALDAIFGTQDHPKLHSRNELGLMITDHLGRQASELDEDEVEIIRGALQLSEKQVEEIMTDIRDVYWLDIDSSIDEAKIDEIKAKSYSRIPVFNKDKTICHGIVRMKDMVDVDFDETPKRVSSLRIFPVKTVGSRTALDTMLRKFIVARTHLIPIVKGDEIIGIITIEDLIEEIIGHEIIDESDHILHRS